MERGDTAGMQILRQQGDGKLCAVILLVREGSVIAGHRNYTKEVWKDISVWTLPGGRSELNETIEETLVREAEEETGITNVSIVDVIGQVPGAKEGDTLLVFYGETREPPKLMEPEKFSEWREVPLQEYLEDEQYDGFNPKGRRMVARYLTQRFSLSLPDRFA